MSGAEALGLLLGVVPVLISAIEHYDDVLRPIHRYRKFNSRSQMFCDEYETERSVFHAECQLLLGEFVGLSTAQEMLADSAHPLWMHENLRTRFEGRLGNLGATCLSTVSKIKGKLIEIDEVYKGFALDIAQPSDAKSAAYKQWLHARKTKLKFAFSEGNLRNSISELRNQNEIFRVISGQIIRFDRQHSGNDQRRKDLSSSKRMHLKQFEMIRTASCRLYEALRSACSAHRDHLVSFCLEATCDASGAESNCSQICFNLAYGPTSGVDVATFSQSHNSSLEQEKGRPSHKSNTADYPEVLYPPASESFAEAKWFKVESTLVFWKKANDEPEYQTIIRGSPREDVTEDQDKHIHDDDLCIRIQTRTDLNANSTRNLVIILNDTQSCRHYIYYPSDHTPPHQGRLSTSLIELLSTSSGHPIGNIPQLHRLRIARSLVMAVLQFYATPWLKESWQSKNLLFNNVNPENWQSYNPSPHLVVHMAAANEKAPEPAAIAQPSLSLAAVVPNLMLFNLGITLLELAYGVPFLSLRQSPGLNTLADTVPADYSAAYRLANNVGVFFGSGYAEVVRKCLRCDFGEGEDLNNPALQERLYEDVICRLERMEDGIRKSQGDI